MEFNNPRTYNWQGSFRGLRNPKNSWDKSDSIFGIGSCRDMRKQFDKVAPLWEKEFAERGIDEDAKFWLEDNGVFAYHYNEDDEEGYYEYVFIGPKDMDLAQRMVKAGPSDRKFLREIGVCIDITAPLYWFSEFDTYKVGTVANSTSKMHKLASTPITIECFEMDDYDNTLPLDTFLDDIWDNRIRECETLRQRFNETKDIRYWKELIRILPESWLQTRTWTGNYETLRNMYFQRRYHKLTEWHQFCDFIETLPYSKELITT